MVTFNDKEQAEQLKEIRENAEERAVAHEAQSLGLAYINLTQAPIQADALRLIPHQEALASSAVPFALIGKKVGLAIRDPKKETLKKLIGNLAKEKYIVTPYLVSTKSFERALARYKDITIEKKSDIGILDIAQEDISSLSKKVRTIDDIKKLTSQVLAVENRTQTSKIVEVIIAGALSLSASDIHFEPNQSEVRLRFRLDGVLNDIETVPQETYRLILSRIKLISGLKLNIENAAQDGRFSINTDTRELEIRTSIIPDAYGESIVMRILDPQSISVPLEELGIPDTLFSIISEEIKKPNGMILTTGPTGSGKTTTLYAFLKKIYSPDIKIITIEDPVEYHLDGIVQTQTDGDAYTFSSGLRAALRQDPDIIMVGEIRDEETAEIAINAALTGHLVLSTLHTNTAAGVFPRLIDLGVDPKVISSAVNIALAQRLVRRLNPESKEKVPLKESEKNRIEKILSGIPSDYGPVQTEHHWVPTETPENPSGFKGRIGIFEAVRVNDEIEKVVREHGSEREIARASRNQGILTMAEEGVLAVLNGETSLEELQRVIELPE